MNKALLNLIRAHFRDHVGYVSAGMESGKDDSKIFMNANENPYVLPGLKGMNRYPEPHPQELLAAYAETYGVEPGQVLATRGADESIALLTRVFCEPHKDAVMIMPPTFGIYKIDASAMPVETIEVPLVETGDTITLDTEAVIEKAQSGKVKIIYICSPNNPTGTVFAHEEILNICKAVEDKSVVVLDEAYIEFSSVGSLSGALEEHPNLLILRTLSKAYSLAGVRMGVTLCADQDFITFMKEKVSDVYPLPKPCVLAAIRAMSEESKGDFSENIQKILNEREKLKEFFRTSKVINRTYDSEANFLLVEMEQAKEFLEFIREQGLVLRDFTDAPGTKNCIRITVGSEEQNDYLVKLMKRFEDGER